MPISPLLLTFQVKCERHGWESSDFTRISRRWFLMENSDLGTNGIFRGIKMRDFYWSTYSSRWEHIQHIWFSVFMLYFVDGIFIGTSKIGNDNIHQNISMKICGSFLCADSPTLHGLCLSAIDTLQWPIDGTKNITMWFIGIKVASSSR